MTKGRGDPLKIRIISGPPHTFGWLRRPELDRSYPNKEAWESPDGTIYLHTKGLPPLVVEKVIEKE